MPTPLQVGDIVEVRVWSSFNGQASVNTVHYYCDAVGAAAATDEDLVDTLVGSTTFVANYKDILTIQAHYDGVQARIINRVPRPVGVASDFGNGPGNENGDAMSTQTCGIISWKTKFTGPRYRGRLYLPFPAEVDNGVDGLPTAGYAIAAGILADTLLTFTNVAGGPRTAQVTLTLLHKSPPFTTTEVFEYQTHRKWATLKKRGSYGRPNISPF